MHSGVTRANFQLSSAVSDPPATTTSITFTYFLWSHFTGGWRAGWRAGGNRFNKSNQRRGERGFQSQLARDIFVCQSVQSVSTNNTKIKIMSAQG